MQVAKKALRHLHRRGALVGSGGSTASCLLEKSCPFYDGPLLRSFEFCSACQGVGWIQVKTSGGGVYVEERRARITKISLLKRKRHTCRLLRPRNELASFHYCGGTVGSPFPHRGAHWKLVKATSLHYT